MRDLFAPVAPRRRDAQAGDAQRRAAKAANIPVFAQAPTTIQTIARKAERIAVEAERDVRRRITERKPAPTLEQRKSCLPANIARKTEGALGVSVGAAELLVLVVSRYLLTGEPVVLAPSSVAEGMKITVDEASRRVGELVERNLILATTNHLGQRGYRPTPDLAR